MMNLPRWREKGGDQTATPSPLNQPQDIHFLRSVLIELQYENENEMCLDGYRIKASSQPKIKIRSMLDNGRGIERGTKEIK